MTPGFELSILFGLMASLSWGLGDFSGGVASRRARALIGLLAGLDCFALLAMTAPLP
jgi:hypothetical protein